MLLRSFAELRRGLDPGAQLLKVGSRDPRWRKETMLAMQSLGLRQGTDVIFLEGLSDEGFADAY